MRIASFNVNGMRAALRAGFLPWLKGSNLDILCLQEIRARRSDLPRDLHPLCGYHSTWNHAARPGYSGTGILSLTRPLETQLRFPGAPAGDEGRVIVATYPGFRLMNCYVPNGNGGPERLRVKLAFYEWLLSASQALHSAEFPLVICCDLNTAHQPIDLVSPETNTRNSGFLPVERAWVDRLIESGFRDAFRCLYPETPGAYTWWSTRHPGAREQNRGWRFDYVFVQSELFARVVDVRILKDVAFSDHCPVEMELDLPLS